MSWLVDAICEETHGEGEDLNDAARDIEDVTGAFRDAARTSEQSFPAPPATWQAHALMMLD